MKIFYTTDAIAKILGISGTHARRRIQAGAWKPTAQTSIGHALFSEAVAQQIITKEINRGKKPSVAVLES